MKMTLKTLGVIAACAALIGCGAPSGTSSKGASASRAPAKITSPAQALRALGTDGVDVTFSTGDPKNPTQSAFTTGFMNMTSTSQYAEIPMRFRATLDNSPAADYIRQNGIPIFVYATAQLKLATVDAKPGSKPRDYTKGVRFEKRTCDGQAFVLYPGNDYTLMMAADQRVEVRSKNSSTLNAGIFSVSSANDWKVTGARPVSSVSHVALEPFMVLPYSQPYKNPTNFGPPHVVSRAIVKSCRYSGHKDFYKSDGNGPRERTRGAPN